MTQNRAKKHLSDFTADERMEISDARRRGQSPYALAERFGTSSMAIRKIYQIEIFS